MAFLVLLILMMFLLLGSLGWMRWRERGYLKKKTSQAMSKGLRMEMEKEEKDAVRRSKKFQDQLKKFAK